MLADEAHEHESEVILLCLADSIVYRAVPEHINHWPDPADFVLADEVQELELEMTLLCQVDFYRNKALKHSSNSLLSKMMLEKTDPTSFWLIHHSLLNMISI